MFKLLKIHGSLNWVLDEDTVEIFNDYSSIHGSPARVPFLVPPTWRKDMIGPLEGIWRTAIDELKHASNIIFIGFSMPETDAYIRYLLTLGLKENVHLNKIIFVNPLHQAAEQEELIKRIKSKFGEQIFRLNIFSPYWIRTDEFFINSTQPGIKHTYDLPLKDRLLDLNKYNIQIGA
jgi:hypothetical protein